MLGYMYLETKPFTVAASSSAEELENAFKALQFKYKDFNINTAHRFQEIFYDQDLADVTLVTVDDIQVKAHKILLISNCIL